MNLDRQGNRLSGASLEALAPYERAVREFNIYRGDPLGAADRAIELAPGFVMAYVLKAYLLALATEPVSSAEAARVVAAARELATDEREDAHLAVLDQVLRGNWESAAVLLDFHNVRYPRDLVALQAGHLMDFYRANARNLRDRIARVLPYWSPSTPGHAIVLGMYSFGLEEAGEYAKAESIGRAALDAEPLDCWAHHAVAHVMEMQGRADEGVRWMVSREVHWAGDDNFFKVHNFWHRALFHLELGQTDEVLRLYDGPVRGTHSGVALDLVDASALLWRLELGGHDVGDRWAEVARCWDSHADGQLYPFNDWHAVMAYLATGRADEVARVVAALERSASGSTDTGRWARAVGLPLIAGFVDFRHRRYRECVERLHRVRHIANQFGGSHAQRDIIDWTLTEAALRGGLDDYSRALAHERLASKPQSRLGLQWLARAGRGSQDVSPT